MWICVFRVKLEKKDNQEPMVPLDLKVRLANLDHLEPLVILAEW